MLVVSEMRSGYRCFIMYLYMIKEEPDIDDGETVIREMGEVNKDDCDCACNCVL